MLLDDVRPVENPIM